MAAEHGIDVNGNSIIDEEMPSSTTNKREDRADLFFTVSDNQKYTPKSILIDLEPSVINKVTSAIPMINPRNVHLSENGSGAANNWKQGYEYGMEYQEEIVNLIDRECDKCENVSNFQLIHSIAGGTGSGVGSLMLEMLNDRYGSKKLMTTSLIFPSNESTSDVVVQPYNTVLTLKRLIDFSDATLVFDNDSLISIENLLFGITPNAMNTGSNSAFEIPNKLISFVMASMTNPLRFPSYMYSSLESILPSLIPTTDLKFLTSSVAPFADLPALGGTKYNFMNLNENELILEMLNDKYKMNRAKPNDTKYISIMNYLMGNKLNQTEIRKGTIKAQKRVEFVPWSASSINTVNGKASPYIGDKSSNHINGLQLSNNTSIIQVFSRILKQYDLLAKREAYINYYTESNNAEERALVMDMFNECKESVLSVIEEYRGCQSMSYLEDYDDI